MKKHGILSEQYQSMVEENNLLRKKNVGYKSELMNASQSLIELNKKLEQMLQAKGVSRGRGGRTGHRR